MDTVEVLHVQHLFVGAVRGIIHLLAIRRVELRGSTNVFINLVIDKTANSIYEGMICCLSPRI